MASKQSKELVDLSRRMSGAIAAVAAFWPCVTAARNSSSRVLASFRDALSEPGVYRFYPLAFRNPVMLNEKAVPGIAIA